MNDPYRSEREARIARLRSDKGWLTVVDKIFLGEGVTPIAGVGSFTLIGGRVTFSAADDAQVTLLRHGGVEDEIVADHDLKTDAEPDPDTLRCGGFLYQLMQRGDSIAIRVRDVRTIPAPFAGIDRFPIDPSWNKRAKLAAHARPERLAIEYEGATDGKVEDTMASPGILVFEHDDERLEMDALLEEGSSRLYIPFRDATSGDESYGPGRFLYAPLPDEKGEVALDFNRAMLPGCAFTIHATCPIPPRRNRLKISVRAGEKNYLAAPLGETG